MNNDKSQTLKSQKLRMEALEDRALLSVAPFENSTLPVYESSAEYVVVEQESIDLGTLRVEAAPENQAAKKEAELSDANLGAKEKTSGDYAAPIKDLQGFYETGADGPATTQVKDLIGVNKLRADASFGDVSGAGFATVIIDSGLNYSAEYFGDRVVYVYDFGDGDSDVADKTTDSHGTNVAAVAAGEQGIANGSDIIFLKVGNSYDDYFYTDATRKALQWCADNAEKYNIASVNMSLGNYSAHAQQEADSSRYSDELAALNAMNVIVCVAAGNDYYSHDKEGLSYPACDPSVVSVGAVSDATFGRVGWTSGATAYSLTADQIVPFSQRADYMTVFAPGFQLDAAGILMGGTSQASPVVAGAATIAQQLANRYMGRSLTVDEFKELVQGTGTQIWDSDTYDDGAIENDNVDNTGKSYKRLDVYELAKKIREYAEGQERANLTSYKPEGWSDALVLSKTLGDTTGASEFQYNDSIYFSAAIQNFGALDAGAFKTTFELKDADGNVVATKTWSVAGLAVGANVSKSGDANWGFSGLAEGTYTLTMTIDSEGAIDEFYKTDNVVTKTFTVVDRRPELAPYVWDGWDDSLVISSVADGETDAAVFATGETVWISASYINQGETTAYSFQTRIEVVDAAGAVVALRTLNDDSLDSGWYRRQWFNIGALSAGTYRVRMSLDSPGAVSESDETNNYLEKTFVVKNATKEARSTVVTSTADVLDSTDGAITLREAIAYAANGATVTFDPSLAGQTIELDGVNLRVAKSLTIDASNLATDYGPGIVVYGNYRSRVFYVDNSASVALKGLTIDGGLAKLGAGALVAAGTSLSLTDCFVAGNETTLEGGGGIQVKPNASFSATNTTFSYNASPTYGGALNVDGTATITDCLFEFNVATYGGAVHVDKTRGSLTATRVEFADNDATYGGALCADGLTTIDDCLFRSNNASETGGALQADGLTTVSNSRFVANDAEDGGAIYVAANVAGTANFTNCEIADNFADYAAGVSVDGTAAFKNCAIADNYAWNGGGGVYVVGEATFTGGEITGNIAFGPGGGVYLYGEATFTDCVISENTAYESGGGVYLLGGGATFTDCAISENIAKDAGGGAYLYGEATFTDCVISENTAQNNGGGVCQLLGEAVFENCVISENTAQNNGGGFRLYDEATLVNCLIAGNSASSYGGGIYDFSYGATLCNCTIAGNEAYYGGGYFSNYSNSELYNTIVAQNVAYYGPDLYKSGSLYGYCVLSSFTEWTGGTYYVYNSSQPLFVNARFGVYSLATGSQALDKGNNSYVSGYATDLAGNARVVGTAVDLGAYEFSTLKPELLPFVPTGWSDALVISTTPDSTVDSTKFTTDDAIYVSGAYLNAGGVNAPYHRVKYELFNEENELVETLTSTTDFELQPNYYAYVIGAGTWNFGSLPEGEYLLRMTIDDEELVDEYDETNNVYERTFTVDAASEKPSLVVTTNVDVVDEHDGLISLREAIQYAEADATLGDVIAFAASMKGETITLSGTQLEIAKGITIDASALYDESTQTPGITIDADEKSRVFYVEGGTTDAPVALIGLTITGGKATDHGGGVYVYNGSAATLTNCVVSGNATTGTYSNGGGVYVYYNSTATFTNCAISGNTASSDGGGVYVSGAATFTNSTISGNAATRETFAYGGGVCVSSSGVATFTNGVISGNTAKHGGGVYVYGSATFTNGAISGNTANYGGGVYVASSGVATFTNGVISDNTANYGGGFYVSSSGSATFTNGAISGNAAKNQGGGVYVSSSGSATFTNGAISGNAASSGGGFYVSSSGVATFTNGSISGNTASSGGGVYVDSGTATLYNTIVALNYNDDVLGGLSANSVNNLIDVDPKFVVGPVFDAQGNLTNADSLDLRLTSESWAIDRGDNTYVVDVATDLDGKARVKQSWASTATVDIGAYEYQATVAKTSETPSLVVTTNLDVLDDTDGVISLREAILYAAADSSLGDTITFAPSLKGKTIILNDGALCVWKGVKIDASAFYDAATQTPGITIDADEKSRVFYVCGGTAENPVAFVGLTIAGGKTSFDGGGVYVFGAATFTNSVVSGNAAKYGGGVYVASESMTTLTNCAVSGNAAERGGGVYSYNGSATLTNCVVSDNTASASGGGIFIPYGESTLTNCAISGNTARNYGGGVYVNGSTTTLRNSIVVQNDAKSGSDVYVYSGTLDAYNTLSSYVDWDNASDDDVENYVYDASLPLFKDAANGDYTLAANSQAIDQGNDAYAVDASGVALQTDLAGNARFVGTVDLGPYEYQQLSTTLTSVALKGTAQVGQTLTASVSPSSATATYQWYRGTSANIVTTAISGATSSTYKLTSADVGYYIKVVATGSGLYTGSVSKTAGPVADAETPSLVVTTNSDVVNNTDGLISLREAIQYAEADSSLGDTITFAAALKGKTITLSGMELTISKGITVDASSLYDASTQTPGITVDANQKSGVFYVSGGTESNPVAFVGLKITGGNAYYGGGVYVWGGAATFTNSTISGNTADGDGGGVYVTGTATFTNSTISGNTATGTLSDGGGVYVTGTATFTNSTISGNTAYYGGGVCVRGSATFTNSTISGNTASNYGGGVYVWGDAATFTNSTISGNTARYGGGVYGNSGTATLYNSIVALNTATSSGGDVHNIRGTLKAYNTLSSYSAWHNAFDDGVVNYVYDASTPLFTDAANGDYTLAANSQAIDKGNNSYISGYSTDLAGNARVTGTCVDLGPYEYPQATALTSVALKGTAQVGKTITATVSPTGATATYQWYRVDANNVATEISGATASTYQPTLADLGFNIRVIATGCGAYTGVVSAKTSAKVKAPLTAVSIGGTAQVGETLTATVSPSGATATWRWYYGKTASSATTAISGATSETFALTDAYVGKYIKVVATGSGNYVGSVSTTIGPIEAVGSAPAAPTNVTFAQNKISTASGTYVNVKWTDVATDETGYRVEVREVGATAWTLAGTTNANKQALAYQDFTPGVAYEYRVRAENAFGASDWATGSFTAMTAPKATVANYDSLAKTATLNLAASELATQMRVEVSTEPFATEATISSSKLFYCVTLKSSTATPTIKNLEAGTTYYVRVRAINAAGVSDWCDTVELKLGPAPSAPAAPTNVTFAQTKLANAGGTYVNVKWTDVATDETGYRIEVREVDATAWTLAGTTKADKQAFAYQDFTPGVAYEYRVRAENAFGASDWATGAFTALAAPSATVASYDALAKTATLNLAASELATQMRVEVSTEPFATEATISSSKLFYCVTLKSSTATPTIKNLEAGTTYYVRVRAINDAGVSDWCDTVELKLGPAPSAPAAPENVTFAQTKLANAGGTYVNVKWTDVATDETGYRVEVREVGATAWTLAGTTKADKQALAYQDFTPGVAYEYRVRAENEFGASDWATGAFTAMTAPEAAVASYDASAKTATLSLAASELATQMRVEVSTEPFATEATISSSKLFYCVTLKSSTATPTIKNLEAGTTYYVRVRAINAAGVSDWCDTLTLQLPTSNAQTDAISDAVSEAFADFFAEDGGEDDFWFEFEKAAGKRR